jgi:hypothetical protein
MFVGEAEKIFIKENYFVAHMSVGPDTTCFSFPLFAFCSFFCLFAFLFFTFYFLFYLFCFWAF